MISKSGRILQAALIVIILGFYGCEQPTEVKEPSQADQELQQLDNESIEGQYIVTLKAGFTTGTQAERANQTDEQINSIAEANSIRSESIINRYRYSVRGFSAQLTDEQVARLRKDDRVDYIEQDRIVTLAPPCGDPPCKGNGNNDDGGNSGQITPWGITRVGGPVASSGTAWVIDTGIDLDHPDLNVDTQRSETFITKGKDAKSADDNNGHGTHVAGTIAALDNDIDVVGVAAGATVVAVKVLDHRGSGTNSGVIAGIDYVAANASSGDVANLSLGGSPSEALDDAVRKAADEGVMFAIAAGNSGDNANNYSPARVEYNNVWTVSASDSNDQFANFSNYSGPVDPPIEFAGPGVDILSLYAEGGTATLDGTSMASPHVAGVLLVTGGNPTSDGTVSGDPDDPDPIIHN